MAYVPLYPFTTEIVPDYVPNTVEIDCDGNIADYYYDTTGISTPPLAPESPQVITSMEPKEECGFTLSTISDELRDIVCSSFLSYELIYDYSCKDPDCTGNGQIFIFSVI